MRHDALRAAGCSWLYGVGEGLVKLYLINKLVVYGWGGPSEARRKV